MDKRHALVWVLWILVGLTAYVVILVTAAHAAGWSTVHRYVRPTGCNGEMLTSWYNTGRKTANGERFNPMGLTAAHRTLPFGTNLTVCNPRNGKCVRVRINDRGPWGLAYRMGARLDLARGAALAIGMHSSQYTCTR